jgi:ubiquinone/menaquinone biosynthesis C-methylase UbiE/uncharacterized protein YbaR (Trm112 family)
MGMFSVHNKGNHFLPLLEEIQPILQCVDCGFKELHINKNKSSLFCKGCGRIYPLLESGILQMLPKKGLPEPEIYKEPDYVKFMKCYEEEGISMVLAEQSKLFRWIHHYGHRVVKSFSDKQLSTGWQLDLGCGEGTHLTYVDNYSKVVALDILSGPLEVVRKRFPGVFIIQGNGCQLPFKNNVFDKIYSIHNLEHMYYLEESLGEIKRTMSVEGGRFYVVLPTEGSVIWNLGRKLVICRRYSKKYGVDYLKVMKVAHCNTLRKVLSTCSRFFTMEKRNVFPFFFLPLVDINMIYTISYSKKSDS